MTDIGYYEPIPGIYGTANPATDSNPIERAALQEAAAQAMFQFTTAAGYVPPGTGYGAPAPEWPTTPGGGNPPITGWTCQNSSGPAFAPYSSQDIGHIPDWTADVNPGAAGAYDQTPVVAYGDYNPLNRAPLGDAVMQYEDDPNPNTSSQFSQGHIGSLEW